MEEARSAGVFLKCWRVRELSFIQAKQKRWAADKDNKQQQEPMMNELAVPKTIYPQTVTATLRVTCLCRAKLTSCLLRHAYSVPYLPVAKIAVLRIRQCRAFFFSESCGRNGCTARIPWLSPAAPPKFRESHSETGIMSSRLCPSVCAGCL
jgi:hypothetical protein